MDKKTAGIGKGTPGPGRPKGCANKATTEARDVFRRLLENNAEKMQGWLDAVADKEPGKALSLMAVLCEFAVPKLARTEHSGPDGKPIGVEHAVKPDLINEILDLVKPQDDPKPPKRDEERRR